MFKKINALVFILVIVVFSITFAVYRLESDWTATGTVCMAGLAGIGIVYSSLTVELIKEENRPYVYVNFVQDDRQPAMIDVELGNYGKSAACHLSINVSIPEKETEMAEKKDILQKMTSMSIFSEEIRFLPPEKSIKVMYGQGWRIAKYFPLEYTFQLSYSDIYHKSYSEEIRISPSYLAHCSRGDSRIEQVLKKIEEDLDKIHQDFDELNTSMRLFTEQQQDLPFKNEHTISDSSHHDDEITQRGQNSTGD